MLPHRTRVPGQPVELAQHPDSNCRSRAQPPSAPDEATDSTVTNTSVTHDRRQGDRLTVAGGRHIGGCSRNGSSPVWLRCRAPRRAQPASASVAPPDLTSVRRGRTRPSDSLVSASTGPTQQGRPAQSVSPHRPPWPQRRTEHHPSPTQGRNILWYYFEEPWEVIRWIRRRDRGCSRSPASHGR